MRISQLLNKDSIIANLSANNKQGVIKELAAAISETDCNGSDGTRRAW
jgi:mannitol/fructose-specific phosphotransferase system IIA component (Ntr-type)